MSRATSTHEDPVTQGHRDRLRDLLEEDPGPVLRVPSSVRDGRVGVAGRAVRGVLVVVLVALTMLGTRAWMARQAAEPTPATSASARTGAKGEEAVATEGDRAPFATATGADPGSGAAPATASQQVTVHVVGQVRRPGVVTLGAGARVGDAVDKAGGTSRSADLSGLNLARLLVDGEQIVVPKPGESPPPAAAAGPGAPAAPAPGAGGPPAQAGSVNINTADQATLETLPGVGPVLAQAIIDWRTQNGRFTTIEELNEVSGIGEKVFAKLASKVVV